MLRWLTLALVALVVIAAPVSAASITGQYVEARTCDVYTGPCFANADTGLTGKHAVMAWKVEKGKLDNVSLDGLSIVAVVQASDTLGLLQTGPANAVLIIDEKADAAQRKALIQLARNQAGDLLGNVIAVEKSAVDLTMCECKEDVCVRLQAGAAKIETRCLDKHHDKACGNESNYYPPLAKGVKAKAAMATEHSFSGKGFNENWKDLNRRGAYVGSFEVR